MKIGIIDAELIAFKKHNFPNLASMKISSYHKQKNDNVTLLLDYNNLDKYDKVYISKVFTKTLVPSHVLNLENVMCGGTGFFYDKAEKLKDEIEHCRPDYELYSDYVQEKLKSGTKRSELTYYLDYSIGYTSRGCFRQCQFCVNKNCKKVNKHSEVKEFLDNDRKYICLLDDNVLAYKNYKEIFKELNETGKRFIFKQGLDERLLTKEKCEILLKSNYVGNYIFAFDNIEDKNVIEEKLKMWNKYKELTKNKNRTKFYIFCGYDREGKYDEAFFVKDIEDTFERIKILMKYNCFAYIMRHENYVKSPFAGTYINLARWCNQPNFYKKMSYKQFCEANQQNKDKLCATMKYFNEFKAAHKEVADKYYNLKF